MEAGHRFWHWSGFVAGAAWAVYFMAVFRAVGRDTTVDSFFSVLKDWQTLAAALVALLGAWMTVRVINQQIDQQRKQEEERRRRKDIAARAALPGALAELVQYARNAYELLLSLHLPGRRISHPVGWTRPAPLGIPADALKVVQAVIETADQSAIPRLVLILRDFQILHTRLTGLIEDVAPGAGMVVSQHNFQIHVADVAAFEVLCNAAFLYARDEVGPDELKINPGDLSTRTFFRDFHEVDHVGLAEVLRNREEELISACTRGVT